MPFQIISNVWLHVASDDQVRHFYLQFESGQYVYEQIKIAMFASFYSGLHLLFLL